MPRPAVEPSSSKTKTVWLAADSDSACASVLNGSVDVPASPALVGSLSTYQAQPAISTVTVPWSVPAVGVLPSVIVYWNVSLGLPQSSAGSLT